MKKITLLLMVFGLMLSTKTLNAQTHFTVTMNNGTTYNSGVSGERFAGYPWGGVGNHVFNSSNSGSISLVIDSYDEATSGPEIYVRFSRVGFGNAPLGWGSDNSTDLKTIASSDFTNGSATVTVSIPDGTLPVAETTDYVNGYLWVLQVVGDNDPEAYVNYVVDIEEKIVLSTKSYNKLESSFYNPSKDVIVLTSNIEGEYNIYDLTGRSILKGKITNEILTSSLRSGVYILKTDKGILKFAK
ncbi:T9SS type A sorting domain-containing protein [Polaribacter marinivivus]|uniref:T9SS type A sorting domain-containing protein n=1 Tax=Polaribacter marinivivus TaxID=1524260 RepID=UPI003D327F20